MRKRNKVSQLNRSADHRKAMIQNMVISLFRYERIESSVAKLKVARSYAERMISRAKRNLDSALGTLDEKQKAEKILHNTRYLYSHLGSQEIVSKLLTDLSNRYATRLGGYTRIVRLVNRQSDNTEMAILELVERKTADELKEERVAKRAKAAAPKAKADAKPKKEKKTK
ncbi:50S ribosomal protein L17 [Leptospira ilyithenensis]|uniref:Large ribosomal subunit protein bL17 n=1 Tax=Leptospira ilyithenensis TaxID=2484901 RepID=A0A4R9LPK4_9LEPT|nr:50S ribosomal protein L17 [Leptospira ilyithenensis]TGN08111.1 50S ribosomal protein L17 [Leptospira ilyithenensis]